VRNMKWMFQDAKAFDQDLSSWNMYLAKVTNMYEMFRGATAFNQKLCWDVNGKNTNRMFFDAGIDAGITSCAGM
jgi:hypothetical protein